MEKPDFVTHVVRWLGLFMLVGLLLVIGRPEDLNVNDGGGGGVDPAVQEKPEYVFPSLCGPQFEGVIVNLAVECWNDASFLTWSMDGAEETGWRYVVESDTDAAGGNDFELIGVAFKETATEVWVVVNANMNWPNGTDVDVTQWNIDHPDDPRDDNVNFGDLFINLSGLNFDQASDARELYAVRFAPNNDSGVSELGVYGNVRAKNVSIFNSGPGSRGGYETHIWIHGNRLPDYGDFPQSMTYFPADSGLNVIDVGDYLGGITPVVGDTLIQAGYDPTRFGGIFTAAFKFEKKLIIDECGVVGGDGTSCVDCDGIACGNAEEDVCGVCNGPGTSCLDCLGEPNGEAEIDQCGICDGDGTSCLDCAGEPFGDAEIDRCGDCGGDGTGCLGCENVDVTQAIVNLDGSAGEQLRYLNKALKILNKKWKRNKKIQRFAEKLRVEAQQHYVDNWNRSWSLPQIITTCQNTTFCVSVDNTPVIFEYIATSNELFKLTRKAIKRARKQSKRDGRPRPKLGRKILKRAKAIKASAENEAQSFPSSYSQCD